MLRKLGKVRKVEVHKMETFFLFYKFYNRGHLVVVDDDEEQWKLLFVRVTRINSPARAHYRPLCEIGFLGQAGPSGCSLHQWFS